MKRANLSLNIAVGMILVLTSIAWAAQEKAKEQKIDVSQLPAAVKQAIETNCPKCEIEKATREVENGVTIYDFEFDDDQGEMDVTADGFVTSRETVVQTTDIPQPALDAIRQGAAGGKIKQVLKEEVRADLKDGQVIKLDTPKYFYEADLEKSDQVAEIVVSPEGQVIEAPQWRKKGTKEP